MLYSVGGKEVGEKGEAENKRCLKVSNVFFHSIFCLVVMPKDANSNGVCPKDLFSVKRRGVTLDVFAIFFQELELPSF